MPVARALPTATTDSTTVQSPTRTGRYGEAYVLPMTGKDWVAADEGSYFVAITPTPGTGVIGPVSTTFDETKALYVLTNNNAASTNIRIYPQFIRLHVTVVSASDSRTQFTFAIDNVVRYSSGGSSLTASNVNMDSTVATGAVHKFGALTTAAAGTSRRVLGHHTLRGTIDVVEDTYTFVFGGVDGVGPGASRVATVEEVSRAVPPVVLGPGQSLLVHHWAGSIGTGITTEAVVGYIER